MAMSPDPRTPQSSSDDLSSPTSQMTSQAHEHERLIMRYIAGERDADLLKRLGELIDDDAELRDELRDELALDRILYQHGRMPLDPAPVLTAIAARPHRDSSLETLVMANIAAQQLPVVTRRWWLGAVAAAAALVVMVIASTSLWAPRAGAPLVEARPFASVHYVQGVQWPAELTTPPDDGARIAPGPVTLSAGVVEIRYDNGVVLALEGPAQVEVWSRMQAHLRHGRLTTNVPPGAQGFTVLADHMRVIDLGTEIGVELARDGHAHVQVYSGAVEIALSDAAASPAQTRVGAGEARAFNPATGAVTTAAFDAGRFIRTGPPRALTLAVSDLVGGGNGRGTATAEGLDATQGVLRSDESIGGVGAARDFRPLTDLPFVDGVFVPGGPTAPTVISSAGHAFTFPVAGGSSYDLIRRGGFMIRPPDGGGVTVPTRSPTVIGGVDHAAFGHHLIGMHANAGMTIDLHEIAKAYGRQPARFTSVVANTAPRRLAQSLAIPPRNASVAVAKDLVSWSVLEPRTYTAVAGTTLTPQGDGSLLAERAKSTDTYIVYGTTTLRRLSAIRLEVLAHPSLPNGGPGAATNGNFILTQLRAAVITANARSEVTLTGVVADFNQEKWHSSNTLLGDDMAGWAVVPETGRSHQAVFFCNPVELPPGAQIEVTLAQHSRRHLQHVIGCFRLGLTDAIDPVQGQAVGAGSFMVLVDGKLVQRSVVPTADQSPARLDVALKPGDRFLTLVSCDGGYGSSYQWTTLGDPRIELVPAGATSNP
jgi:hypothetical protein